MTVFYIILRNLALINFFLFGEEVHRKGLLKHRIALVFFVSKNTFYRTNRPFYFTGWCWHFSLSELLCNTRWGLSFKEKPINQPNANGFRFHNLRQTILALFVTKEPPIWQADLPVCKTFSLTPGNIFRDASAFFLAEARGILPLFEDRPINITEHLNKLLYMFPHTLCHYKKTIIPYVPLISMISINVDIALPRTRRALSR